MEQHLDARLDGLDSTFAHKALGVFSSSGVSIRTLVQVKQVSTLVHKALMGLHSDGFRLVSICTLVLVKQVNCGVI